MVYENYQTVKRKDTDDEEVMDEPVAISCKRLATDPFVDYKEHYDDDGPKPPRFSPPAYIQRYLAVQNVLADSKYEGKIKKVVDFGCSEFGFVTHLKNTNFIEEIMCVDVDRETLELNKAKVMPLNADYLHTRSNPLRVHVYEGSVTHRDSRLANFDAVVAIELIEHLYPDALMDLPYNIFGFIKPLVVVVTTPNADFNVLFGSMGNKMRHWDHKFEWTRLQFEDWANNITSRYPDYDVTFQGIGPGPPGTDKLGCCSQMAIFNRTREIANLPNQGIDDLLTLITTVDYPHRTDNRSDEEKILDEAAYYIRRFAQNDADCENGYPLSSLLRQLEKFSITAETLREILENSGYTIIQRDNVDTILCPALSTFSDYDDVMDDDMIDDYWIDRDVQTNPTTYDQNFGNWNENADDECWDDDYDIPATNLRTTEATVADGGERVAVEFEFSVTRSLDPADFSGMEILNLSHVTSTRDESRTNGLAAFLGSFESNDDEDENVCRKDENFSLDDSNDLNSKRMENVETNGENGILSTSNESNTKSHVKDDCKMEINDISDNVSLCSIFLESSRNDERQTCPENITDPNFDCGSLESSCEAKNFENPSSTKFLGLKNVEDSKDFENPLSTKFLDLKNDEKSSSDVVNCAVNQPQFTSSPRIHADSQKNLETKEKSFSRRDHVESSKNDDQTFEQNNDNVSTLNSHSGTLKKYFPSNETQKNEDREESKVENEITNDFDKNIASGSREKNSHDDTEIRLNLDDGPRTKRLSRQRAPESLELRRTNKHFNKFSSNNENSNNYEKEFTKIIIRQNDDEKFSGKNVDEIVRSKDENLVSSMDRINGEKMREEATRLLENFDSHEAKSSTSSNAPETPPNSWSPEIMDSGYPNSSSAQDTTPEYDLSSIAQDRDSDSESPSPDEIPVLIFPVHADVVNGDLANNNRDDEGNNVVAPMEFNDLDDDLQPFIDVLENDLENENDIYAIENDFPVWLLRILERGNGRQNVVGDDGERLAVDVNAAGDAGMPDLDEGFDSTSSDEDNVDEASTESSEATIDWNASGRTRAGKYRGT